MKLPRAFFQELETKINQILQSRVGEGLRERLSQVFGHPVGGEGIPDDFPSGLSPHMKYLLGTGCWGPRHVPVPTYVPYIWRADMGSVHKFPMVRGINPEKIAVRISPIALKTANGRARRGEIPWSDDYYKTEFYNIEDELDLGFDLGILKFVENLEVDFGNQ